MIAISATVTGGVQGVGFRWSARHEALRLGLVGWVRNLPDGSVEVHAEGDPVAIERFLHWLSLGPPAAGVSSVRHIPVEPVGVATFEVAN